MLDPSQSRYEVRPEGAAVSGIDLSESDTGTDTDTMVLGIDLGTSNCCCSIVEDGAPTIVDLREGSTATSSRSIPSVLSFGDGGNIAVGHDALRLAADRPQQTIIGAKRFVGRSYDSVAVQKMLGRFPYQVVPGRDGRVAVRIDGRAHTLTNLSGRLLKRVREVVQNRVRRPVERAIITVPAYYNDNQRDAVVQAGRLAGLQVERIISEPTAAAIGFGLSLHRPQTILVYDFGGGTFDVSVMRVGDGQMRVLACSGDTFLGGNDIDAALAHLACERFFASTGRRVRGGFSSAWCLGQAAEASKRRLTSHATTKLVVRSVPLAGDETGRMEVEITQRDLDSVARPFVSRSLAICRSALLLAGLRREDVGEVLLVGGQTRMPLVRSMVEDFFDCPIRSDINPDEAVALGAGILGALPKEVATRFQDVLPMSIGIAMGGVMQVVLPRNAPLPCDRRVKLRIPEREHGTRVLEIWQGDSQEVFRNEFLGKVPVATLQPPAGGVQNVALHFRMSGDGRLEIEISDEDTGESHPVLFRSGM